MSTLPELVSWDTPTVLRAMFASCLYEKFACTAWSDPGIVFDETKDNYINYWEPWYLGYYPHPGKRSGATTAITLQQVSMPGYVKRGMIYMNSILYWLLAHFSYQEVILIM